MDSLAKLYHSHQTLPPSLNHHRSSPPTPFSSLSFRPLPPFSSSPSHSSSIRASSSPKDPSFQTPKHPFTHFLLQTLNPLFSPLFEPFLVALVAAALFFTRRQLKPLRALPTPAPKTAVENLPKEENDSFVEEQLINDDVEALKSLVEVQIRERKIDEAIRLVDRLIELDPGEFDYPLLKAELHNSNGEHELALHVFEDMLKKDPFCVEAFHGIMMASFELDKPTEEVVRRVEEAMTLCKKEKMDSEVRDLKLLIAQAKVVEGDLDGAVKVYEEVAEEEPKDFRPYLCRGILYSILKKKDEAEKQFEKFRELVPDDHPYKEYFEDKADVYSQELLREVAGAKS